MIKSTHSFWTLFLFVTALSYGQDFSMVTQRKIGGYFLDKVERGKVARSTSLRWIGMYGTNAGRFLAAGNSES